MSNCLVNTLKNIWSFLLGSMRFILFIVCFALFLIQLAGIFGLSAFSSLTKDMPGGGLSLRDWIQMLLMLGLSLLGCYASFYKHPPSLKWFTYLNLISAGALFLMLVFVMPGQMEAENRAYFAKMQDNLPKYQWHRQLFILDSNLNQETIAWDLLQSTACCGINGPDDWAIYRPTDVSPREYPSTCCISNGHKLCNLDTNPTFRTVGCAKRMEEIQTMGRIFLGQYIIFQIILSLMAFAIGHLNYRPQSSSTRTIVTQEMGTNLGDPNYAYQGNIYVRQPPLNQSYQMSGKANDSSLYPNAGAVEKSGYSAPPPSYGAGY